MMILLGFSPYCRVVPVWWSLSRYVASFPVRQLLLFREPSAQLFPFFNTHSNHNYVVGRCIWVPSKGHIRRCQSPVFVAKGAGRLTVAAGPRISGVSRWWVVRDIIIFREAQAHAVTDHWSRMVVAVDLCCCWIAPTDPRGWVADPRRSRDRPFFVAFVTNLNQAALNGFPHARGNHQVWKTVFGAQLTRPYSKIQIYRLTTLGKQGVPIYII